MSTEQELSYNDFTYAPMQLEESKNCVSREEFDSLQKELNYWQNTTVNILKKYLIDNERKSKRLKSRAGMMIIVIYY